MAMIVLTGSNQGIYFYYYDGLGSVAALSNISGTIVEQKREGASPPMGLRKMPAFAENAIGRLDTETAAATPEGWGLYYYRARVYHPALARFMQTDPIGYYDAMNLYQYCGNNPVNWLDPWGLRVELQWHEVGAGQYHTKLRITPDNQAAYINDPRFKDKNGNLRRDKNGRIYTTLGAGPEGGIGPVGERLVSEDGRDRDVNQQNAGSIELEPKMCIRGQGTPQYPKTEDDLIQELFNIDSRYGDNAEYDLVPARDGNRKWWRADNGYNSNSYTRGLLDASGYQTPYLELEGYSTPGWNKPLPFP